MTHIAREHCTWVETLGDAWETSCGNTFDLNDDTPLNNHFIYCPYCGADIAEERYSRDLEDD